MLFNAIWPQELITSSFAFYILYIPLFLFGSVVGSFLNVVIFRTPQILLSEWEKEESEDEEPLEIPDHFFQRLIFSIKYISIDLFLSFAYIF